MAWDRDLLIEAMLAILSHGLAQLIDMTICEGETQPTRFIRTVRYQELNVSAAPPARPVSHPAN